MYLCAEDPMVSPTLYNYTCRDIHTWRNPGSSWDGYTGSDQESTAEVKHDHPATQEFIMEDRDFPELGERPPGSDLLEFFDHHFAHNRLGLEMVTLPSMVYNANDDKAVEILRIISENELTCCSRKRCHYARGKPPCGIFIQQQAFFNTM